MVVVGGFGVAVIVAAKWANFGLSVSVLPIFASKCHIGVVGALRSSCSSRWHTPVAHIVLVMEYNRFV